MFYKPLLFCLLNLFSILARGHVASDKRKCIKMKSFRVRSKHAGETLRKCYTTVTAARPWQKQKQSGWAKSCPSCVRNL